MPDDYETLFGQLVQRAISRGHGERPAIQSGDEVVTYDELSRLVLSFAGKLLSSEVGRGDRVLLYLPNSIEYLVALLSATSLGAIAVPINADTRQERLGYVVDNTRPKCCVALKTTGIASTARTQCIEIDHTRVALACSSGSRTTTSKRGQLSTTTAEDPAIILFSSGTTGRPKGVLLRHRHLLATASTLVDVFGINENHRELIVCPMCHSGGWQRIAATLSAGGCVVIPQGMLSITGILDDIHTHRVTGLFSPPPLWRYMLMTAPEKVRSQAASLLSIEIGSAALKAPELDDLMDLFPKTRIFFHYGMTECSRAFLLDTTSHPDKLHTVGKVSPGVEARIADESGRPLPADEPGQILLRGNRKADRYWNRPDLDRRCFRDGWVATGDYGSLDADGFLTYLGRSDEMITSAGFHFFPAEVEAELGPVDDVAEYLIAGVPDSQGILGEVPWAFVVPKAPEKWTPHQFLSATRERLASYMVPRNIIPVSSLVLTPSGKPDRRKTLERYGSPTQKEHEKWTKAELPVN